MSFLSHHTVSITYIVCSWVFAFGHRPMVGSPCVSLPFLLLRVLQLCYHTFLTMPGWHHLFPQTLNRPTTGHFEYLFWRHLCHDFYNCGGGRFLFKFNDAYTNLWSAILASSTPLTFTFVISLTMTRSRVVFVVIVTLVGLLIALRSKCFNIFYSFSHFRYYGRVISLSWSLQLSRYFPGWPNIF